MCYVVVVRNRTPYYNTPNDPSSHHEPSPDESYYEEQSFCVFALSLFYTQRSLREGYDYDRRFLHEFLFLFYGVNVAAMPFETTGKTSPLLLMSWAPETDTFLTCYKTVHDFVWTS